MGLVDIENEEDVNRYYVNNIIGWPQDGKYIPVLVTEAREGVVYTRTELGEGRAVPFSTFVNDCHITMPRTTVFESEGAAIYSYASSDRQWGRGFVVRRLRLHPFDSARTIIPSSYEQARCLYNPVYYDFSVALDKLASGDSIGVPISRRSALILRDNTSAILLTYKRDVIGYLTDTGINIFSKYKHALVDIGACLPRKVDLV